MPDFPIRVPDDDGDEITIDAGPWGAVTLIASEGIGFYTFSGERRDAFDQAWIAASHETDRQQRAAMEAPATEPPLHHGEGITGMYWDNLGSGHG